jgi:hypothetical protein
MGESGLKNFAVVVGELGLLKLAGNQGPVSV